MDKKIDLVKSLLTKNMQDKIINKEHITKS